VDQALFGTERPWQRLGARKKVRKVCRKLLQAQIGHVFSKIRLIKTAGYAVGMGVAIWFIKKRFESGWRFWWLFQYLLKGDRL
jgi:hypothetical protein